MPITCPSFLSKTSTFHILILTTAIVHINIYLQRRCSHTLYIRKSIIFPECSTVNRLSHLFVGHNVQAGANVLERNVAELHPRPAPMRSFKSPSGRHHNSYFSGASTESLKAMSTPQTSGSTQVIWEQHLAHLQQKVFRDPPLHRSNPIHLADYDTQAPLKQILRLDHAHLGKVPRETARFDRQEA